MNFNRLVVLSALVVGAAVSANAQWYNGDPNRTNGLASERNTVVSDARTYENFNVTGSAWNVTALYGHFYLGPFATGQTFTNAYWEVRTGCSVGNGGTILQSGTTACTLTANGYDDFGFDGRKVSVGVNFNLNPGTYWMTIAPVGDIAGVGRAFVDQTSGANGVGTPIADGVALFDSPFFGANFADALAFAGQTNFSYGVDARPVPEPASMIALASLGIVALKRRRK